MIIHIIGRIIAIFGAVLIIGITGTSNGWIPPSGYIYFRGTNPYNFNIGSYFGYAQHGIVLNEYGGAYLKNEGDSYVSVWCSGSPVDLTNVSTIRLYIRQISGDDTGSQYIYLYYGSDRTASREGYKKVSYTASYSGFSVDIDVSDITGSKYLGFEIDAGETNTGILAVHAIQLL